MDLNNDDICLNWTPLYHDMGLVNNFLLCLTKGVPLAILSPMDFINKPALWLRGLYDTRSTITWSPNFGFAITAEIVRDDQIEGVNLNRSQGILERCGADPHRNDRCLLQAFCSLRVAS